MKQLEPSVHLEPFETNQLKPYFEILAMVEEI